MGGRSSKTTYRIGEEVELCNFKNKPQMNGRRAVVRGPTKGKPGQWDLKMDDGSLTTIKEDHIRKAVGPPRNTQPPPGQASYGRPGAPGYGQQASAVVIGPDANRNGIPDVLEGQQQGSPGYGGQRAQYTGMGQDGRYQDQRSPDRDRQHQHRHHHHHHRDEEDYDARGGHHHHHHHHHDQAAQPGGAPQAPLAMAVVSGADMDRNGIPDSLDHALPPDVMVQGFGGGTGVRSLYEPGTAVEVKWFEDKTNHYEEWLPGVVVMSRHIQNMYLVQLDPATPPFWCPLDCLRMPVRDELDDDLLYGQPQYMTPPYAYWTAAPSPPPQLLAPPPPWLTVYAGARPPPPPMLMPAFTTTTTVVMPPHGGYPFPRPPPFVPLVQVR